MNSRFLQFIARIYNASHRDEWHDCINTPDLAQKCIYLEHLWQIYLMRSYISHPILIIIATLEPWTTINLHKEATFRSEWTRSKVEAFRGVNWSTKAMTSTRQIYTVGRLGGMILAPR